jgi:hypothetical protein
MRIVTRVGVIVTKITDLVWMIGFIGTLVKSSLNHTQLQSLLFSTHFRFNVAHTLGFSFNSLLLATDLNIETSTSNHYEVVLPFLVQSAWNLGTQLRVRLLLTPPASSLDFCSLL